MLKTLNIFRDLSSDCSGMALVEFALVSPFMLAVIAGGTEVTNYAVTSTQVSQIALQLADNGARMGEGDPLANKKISERQINDVLTGAGIHSGPLDIYGDHKEGNDTVPNGRVIMSSLEYIKTTNPKRYRIAWQRCRGNATEFAPEYGEYGKASGTNMEGMGPADRQVTAPDNTPVIFVEIHYRYRPLFLNGLATREYSDISSIAAMMVRDNRDLTQVYNPEGQPVATCDV